MDLRVEVVKDYDGMSLLAQVFCKTAANKTCTASDQNVHLSTHHSTFSIMLAGFP
jgi:hypothetical protein